MSPDRPVRPSSPSGSGRPDRRYGHARSDRQRRGRSGTDPGASGAPSVDAAALVAGRRIELTVGDPAHGGTCVARFEGRVVFVRHALPGEQVLAEVTSVRSKLAFADAVEIRVASPDRVTPPCPLAHPGGCGGCDLQHVALPAQRKWKAGVVSGQLRRIAGLDVAVVVDPVPGDTGGLGWRTRVRYATGADGRLGLRRHRSHDVVPVEVCAVAQPGLPAVTDLPWPGTASVEAVLSGTGEGLVVVEPGVRPRVHVPSGLGADGVLTTDGARLRGRTHLHEEAAGRTWRVTGSGFWQVHPGAADTFAAAVLEMLDPQPGESALDLYSGVGLFAGVIAERVGELGRVTAVEGSATAVADARRNLHDLPQVSLVVGRVEEALADGSVTEHVDVVVLDPPRVGAGAEVVAAVVSRTPRAVVYVACDPAALARDVGSFVAAGFELTAIRGFDAFPMTHHVECVALLTPTAVVEGWAQPSGPARVKAVRSGRPRTPGRRTPVRHRGRGPRFVGRRTW